MRPTLFAFGVAAIAAAAAGPAAAHCDTMDGPVVVTAREALATGDLNPLLAWVPAADEAEVRAAFAEATTVRRLGPEAERLADRWFFETVVRIHRAGEGEPYTGLKPAGSAESAALAAADQAVASGDPEGVTALLGAALHSEIAARLARLGGMKGPGGDVARGREWVAAYVQFVHTVLEVEAALHGPAGPHSAHEH